MLRNYFKSSIRNILRERYFSLINIVGLALGISVCLLIWSYVRFEMSYDNFHKDLDRLYRVNQTLIWAPDGGMMGSTGPQLALVLKEDFPEVEEAMRVNTPGDFLVKYQQPNGQIKAFNEDNVLAADSNFFNFFSVPLKEGNPATALHGLDKVVISNETAKKLFGDESALGKILLFGDEGKAVEVTGVTETQPDNMHFHFDYLISLYTNPSIKRFEWSWIWTQTATYVKLKPGADVAGLEKKMQSMVELNVKPSLGRMGMSYEEFMKGKGEWTFALQPVQSIHLYSGNMDNRIGPVGDIKYVQIFSFVALFVLVLAIINFVNLSTARGASRAKEVGVKKVLGAFRQSLILQFQLESILMTSVATLLGLGLLELFRIVISNVLSIKMPFSIWDGGSSLWLIILLPVVVGFVAGIYPAFYLTSFKPANVLKGRVASGFKSGLRNGLVTVQFVVSIVFIIATIIVQQQLAFFQSANLGFNKENILVLNNADKLTDHVNAFRDEVSALPGVIDASVGMTVPGRGSYEDIFGAEGRDIELSISQSKIDEHYFKTMGLSLIAGRAFDINSPGDKTKVIPNETTVRLFGWTPEEALGKRITYSELDGVGEIIGVVKDFHYASLHQEINPSVFYHIDSDMWETGKVIAINIESSRATDIIASLKEKWEARVNDAPFEYSFLDQEWSRQYQQEQRLGGLFSIFAGLSLLIAMIGLVGLVTYSADKRKKEIGVRKVMGASVHQVVFLLNKNFTLLVLIAFVIAVPLGWYAMDDWLSQFPYPVKISFGSFAVAGLLMLGITWITVAYQSIKAGLKNPVDVLKEE
ncbi:MAG TPA: ABC transporter permease [Cyclobacteriaceae bacterium]|nr:ABC transporter permease [Cyclobacteriaceae bacterium]